MPFTSIRGFVCLALLASMAGLRADGQSWTYSFGLIQQALPPTHQAGRALVLVQMAAGFRSAGMPDAEDSLFTLAADAAVHSGQPSVEASVFSWYASEPDHHNPARAQRAANELMRLGKENGAVNWQTDAHRALARLHLTANNYKDAQEEARQAYHYETQQETPPARLIDALLLLGECQEKVGDKPEAFRSYLAARTLAVKESDRAAEGRVYGELAAFHFNIEDDANAKEYWKRQLAIESALPADSDEIMATENNLAGALYGLENWDEGLVISNRIIDYAKRNKNDELLNNAFLVLRSQYIDADRIGDLKNLYLVKHRDVFRQVEQTQPLLYQRLRAFFAELDGDNDSAIYWYLSAEQIFPTDDAMAFQRMRFQQRLGEFFIRQRNYPAARQRLEAAYQGAMQYNYPIYLAITATLLDSLERLEGDYQSAYQYARLAEEARRQQASAVSRDKLLQLGLENEKRTQELEELKRADAIRHRFNLQYTLIAIAIIIAFIGVLLLRSAHVSPRTLRVISFLSFILLFEFIILLADLFFHLLTHGEPWQMILLKLVFIAGLSQLHHWLEHKLGHYLAVHEPFTELRRRVKSWWRKDPQHQTSAVPHPHPPVEPTESTDEIF